jgi:hypothetical protein
MPGSDIVAVRAEERRLRCVQADRVSERADQIFRQIVALKIGARGRVDFAAPTSKLEALIRESKGLLQVFEAVLLGGCVFSQHNH